MTSKLVFFPLCPCSELEMCTNWEERQPGQLTWIDQRDSPCYKTLCSAVKMVEWRVVGMGHSHCSELAEHWSAQKGQWGIAFAWLISPFVSPFISSSLPTSFSAFVFPVLFLIPLGKKRSKQVAVWGFTASCGQYNIEFKEETWSCMERSLLFISALVLHFQMRSVLYLLQTPCRCEESFSIVTPHCKKLPYEVWSCHARVAPSVSVWPW